jgi:SET domain-containing protein
MSGISAEEFQAEADAMNAALLGCTVAQLHHARQSRRCLDQSCSKLLDLYPSFCNEHGPIAYEMEVKESKLPGAGLGLFTKVDLSAGDFIALYHADVKVAEGDEENNDYCLEIPSQLHNGVTLVVDAGKVGSTLGRYANDSRDGAQNANFAFQRSERGYMVPFIKALRLIRDGEEIFVSYGQSYWDSHDERGRRVCRRLE